MKMIKIALIQHPPVFLNLSESLKEACRLIGEAASAGAEIIVFPETWLPGYPVWIDSAPGSSLWGSSAAKAIFRCLYNNSVEIPGPQTDILLKKAKETGTVLMIGVNEKCGGTLYNSLLIFGNSGQDLVIHRKLVPTYTERLIWGRGDGSTLYILPSELGNIGGLICWEHWMPHARAVMHSLNEVIHLAQWPSVHELHQIASRQYAFEGACFVLASGTVMSKGNVLEGYRSSSDFETAGEELLMSIEGDDSKLLLTGGSCIIAPDASYVVEPVFNQPGIVYGDIALKQVAEARQYLDTNGHYSRPDIFTLKVNRQVQTNVEFEE